MIGGGGKVFISFLSLISVLTETKKMKAARRFFRQSSPKGASFFQPP
jgi:hypothetical protein